MLAPAMMSNTPTNTASGRRFLQILGRVLTIALMAVLVAWLLNQISRSLSQSPRPAGFGRGLVQGALMPMALPNLLFGNDVAIYAEHNTGVSYKLGYTAGVNGCGAIFFGAFFWRLHRLKRWAAGQQKA
jgi:hypothetical protein